MLKSEARIENKQGRGEIDRAEVDLDEEDEMRMR